MCIDEVSYSSIKGNKGSLDLIKRTYFYMFSYYACIPFLEKDYV